MAVIEQILLELAEHRALLKKLVDKSKNIDNLPMNEGDLDNISFPVYNGSKSKTEKVIFSQLFQNAREKGFIAIDEINLTANVGVSLTIPEDSKLYAVEIATSGNVGIYSDAACTNLLLNNYLGNTEYSSILIMNLIDIDVWIKSDIDNSVVPIILKY